MNHYKIRSKNNGLFVKGTPMYHHLDKQGRIFPSIGRLRSFITSVVNTSSASGSLDNWEIVEYEMIEKEVKSVHDFVSPATIIKLMRK